MRAETIRAAVRLIACADDAVNAVSADDENAGAMLSEAVWDFVDALADELGTPREVLRSDISPQHGRKRRGNEQRM